MTENKKSSYRNVFKATSIFGGLQVFQIGVGLIRSKLAASLLGTAGYGINSLLNSPLGLIGSLTSLGIAYSAIRNLSEAHGDNDADKFGRTVKTFRRWVWITGLLGMLVTIVLSPILSKSSFGNSDYTWAFVALSVTFLINAVSSGQGSVLYATRRIKDTTRSSMIGGVLGIFTAIPLYYLYGVKGIVPATIVASITSLTLSWYFSRKVPVKDVEITYKESFNEGISFVKLGFFMTLSGMMGSAIAFLISVFISHIGGVSEVGLYNSGWSITERYVGMVFAAMGADYYPRLAAVNKDNNAVTEAVNQQAEVSILILGPIMLLYLTSLPILIPLMYSKEFLGVIPFSQWVVMGMLLKGIGWCMGFITLAKGESSLFFRLELISTVFQTFAIMGGYYLFGLEGVGIAFVSLYIFYVSYLYLFFRKSQGFRFSNSLISVFLVQQSFCIAGFLAVKFLPMTFGYAACGILLTSSIVHSLFELNKRLDFNGILDKIKHKFSANE